MTKKQQEANEVQRDLAFGLFLPVCLTRQPDTKQATLDALEMAKVSLETAKEYFKPKPKPEPEPDPEGKGDGEEGDK